MTPTPSAVQLVELQRLRTLLAELQWAGRTIGRTIYDETKTSEDVQRAHHAAYALQDEAEAIVERLVDLAIAHGQVG